MNDAREVRVFAPLGPNPAPLTELLWALVRQRDLRVVGVDLVVTADAALYLEGEVFGPRGALAALRTELGDRVPGPEGFVVHEAGGAGGLVEDDLREADAAIYRAAVWAGARAAIAAAGDRAVVFGFIAGRRRTMTVLQASVFSLLARPRDFAVDVRVDDLRVEGGTGFFFPEQADRWLETQRGQVDARAVAVHLVPVELPRLGALLGESALGSFDAALAAGQAALHDVTPPRVLVDLVEGELHVDGERTPLKGSKLFWFAVLATARRAGDGWVTWNHAEEVIEVAHAVVGSGWYSEVRSKALRAFIEAKAAGAKGKVLDDDGALRRQRTDLRKALDALASSGPTSWRTYLVPQEMRKEHNWRARLRLPSPYLEIRWPAGARERSVNPAFQVRAGR